MVSKGWVTWMVAERGKAGVCVRVGTILVTMGLPPPPPPPQTGKQSRRFVKHLIRVCVCVYLGSFDSFIKDEPSCQHRALSALQGCFPWLFYGTLSQSRVGDFYVGKRPPNAKHSPSLKRVFSGLLQCSRGFLSYCFLVVHRAFPGPQVCVFCSKASLASKSFPTFLVHLKDQFPGKERGILGHCLGAP